MQVSLSPISIDMRLAQGSAGAVAGDSNSIIAAFVFGALIGCGGAVIFMRMQKVAK